MFRLQQLSRIPKALPFPSLTFYLSPYSVHPSLPTSFILYSISSRFLSPYLSRSVSLSLCLSFTFSPPPCLCLTLSQSLSFSLPKSPTPSLSLSLSLSLSQRSSVPNYMVAVLALLSFQPWRLIIEPVCVVSATARLLYLPLGPRGTLGPWGSLHILILSRPRWTVWTESNTKTRIQLHTDTLKRERERERERERDLLNIYSLPTAATTSRWLPVGWSV